MRRDRSSTPASAIWRRVLSTPAAVGAVIALAAGASTGAQSASHASAPGAAAITRASGPGAMPRAASSLGGTWRLLPRAPVTRSPGDLTAVWTGHQMIIHGNYSRKAGGIRGVTVAYWPATRRWARLADGPARPSASATADVAVWTGSLMLVPGQTSAVYDPASNTWRPMPKTPMPLSGAVTGWTGHEFLAWGGTRRGHNSRDGYAYNPASGTWRKLPAAPLAARRYATGAWAGRELVVAGGNRQPMSGWGMYFRDAAAYNPATGTWRKIAPMPRRQAGATAVWDGTEILFIGGRGRSGLFSRGLAYNPAANRWRLLPAMAYPRSGFAAVRAGRRVLVWGGLTAARIPPPHGEAYTPATNKWAALPQAPLRGRAGPVAVWTGRRMIVWGGQTSTRGFTDGAAYIPAPAAVSWGRAIEVPGLAALNTADAQVNSVSCALAGNCAAGGYYTDSGGHQQGFVTSERDGAWGTAIKESGPVSSVSCPSAGNCAAGGSYTDAPGHYQGFVADEQDGAWGTAIEVPGLAALNTGRGAEVWEVSCASAGNCAAGGSYTDSGGRQQGFVAVEENGAWGTAIEVPGLAALNTADAQVNSVSCASRGSCAVGGDYTDRFGFAQGFVADQRNGAWDKAIPVPGLAALNEEDASVSSVSCASPGNCAAGGFYSVNSGKSTEGFVASERNGAWGMAIPVPGQAVFTEHGDEYAEVNSVSCGSAGSCAAVGEYPDRRDNQRGFVVVERDGRWGAAIEVPGLAALNTSGWANVYSVSCPSAGSCAAVGRYRDRHGHFQGFVVVERHGRWGKAIEVPGLAALNTGGWAEVYSVSCASAGSCAAGGFYTDRRRHEQGFVTKAG